jgi:hypothetical protein
MTPCRDIAAIHQVWPDIRNIWRRELDGALRVIGAGEYR